MELKDYYAIMGVKPTDDLKTIKTAYRRLARKYHPDVSKEPDAEARFKEVAEAWEVLSDEQRRAEYDQLWQHRNDPQFNRQFQQHEGQPYNAEDFDDIFSSIFGQHGRHELYEINYSGSQDEIRLQCLRQAQSSGNMDKMMAMVDRCLSEYDQNGWTVSHLHNNDDINQLDKLLK
ncbi:TPA: DnaJ domain-containing protein [Salmonella enterica]|uniref:DnaJ domain-containing protein n=1 Tax=Salmonella enterica TaxID=28901 RepID=A0A749II04_SALER|nr:DnaJ domain-containing protein [Salmonella enterica]